MASQPLDEKRYNKKALPVPSSLDRTSVENSDISRLNFPLE